jgi:sugar phosphate isomerase/epimerase
MPPGVEILENSQVNTKSRRRFLIQSGRLGAAALAAPWLSSRALANPLGRPIGVQLYTIKEAMEADAAGTLAQLAKIGFREVETAGFGTLGAKQFRRLLDDAGLACPSAHLSFDLANLDAAFDDAHALGAKYAASGSLDGLLLPKKPWSATRAMSLDEARRTAEIANRIGAGAKRAGLQYTYHNHAFELTDAGGGVTGYDVLLRETDPELVKFEIDCGWMVFAGHNPVDYFTKHPQRFPLIHVKDFLPADDKGGSKEMHGAELGHGSIDYKPILAAAGKAGLQHFFVEQEGPFARMTPLQAVKVDYDYLHAMK